MELPQVLENISCNTQRLLHRLGLSIPRHAIRTPTHTGTLSLPEPRPIIENLLAQGLKKSVAERLSQAYLRHAYQLKAEYEKNAGAFMGEHPDSDGDNRSIIAALATRYGRALQEWSDLVLKLSVDRARIELASVSKRSDSLPSFKSWAVPILESSFSRNPYPSRAQKLELAMQTGMEPRQIHIWFQNRRSRTRTRGCGSRKIAFVRESLTLPTSCSSGPLTRMLQRAAHHPVTRHGLHNESRGPSYSNASKQNLDDLGAHPPHAFPGPFPPVCDYDPFPIADSTALFTTLWPRRAMTESLVARKTLLSIDELSLSLSQMKLTSSCENDDRSSNFSKTRSTWTITACCPSLVLPFPAPLPALMRNTATVHPANCSVSNLSCLQSTRLTKPMLSHRVSKSSATLSRVFSHPYGTISTSRHSARISRQSSTSSLSSLSSDCSLDSVSTSPLSIDTPLATPHSSPTDLPQPTKSSASFTLSLLPGLGGLFCIYDSPSPTPDN